MNYHYIGAAAAAANSATSFSSSSTRNNDNFVSPDSILTVAEKIAACSKRIAARNDDYYSHHQHQQQHQQQQHQHQHQHQQQQHAANTARAALSSYGPGQNFETITCSAHPPAAAALMQQQQQQQQETHLSAREHAQLAVLAEYKLLHIHHDTISSLLANERQSQLSHLSTASQQMQHHDSQYPQMSNNMLLLASSQQHHQHRNQTDFHPINHPEAATPGSVQIPASPPSACASRNASNDAVLLPLNSQGRPRAFETFPMTLHRALATLELTPEGKDIACFLPDGQSFQVRNQYLLEKKMLPIYFPKMRSFASFQRQLNLYNFYRIGGAGIDRGSYRHQLFLRDFPVFSSQMKRTKVKRREKPLLSRGEHSNDFQGGTAPAK